MEKQVSIAEAGQSVAVGAPNFAEFVEVSKTTAQAQIDQLLGQLQARKDDWVQLEIHERLSILDEIHNDLWGLKEPWIRAELEGKGNTPQTLGEAGEWTVLATMFRAVRMIRQSLVEIQKHGRPGFSGPMVSRPNNRLAARVFPHTLMERLQFPGVSGEVWMEPGGRAAQSPQLTRLRLSIFDPKAVP